MKNRNQELLNDVLTGLLVAATFAAVAPSGAMAQLSQAVSNSASNVATPFINAVNYISYGLGTVLSVAGIAHCKKHADNPGQNPLGPALGKLGAGAAFLAAPTVIGMLQSTSTNTLGGAAANFNQFNAIP